MLDHGVNIVLSILRDVWFYLKLLLTFLGGGRNFLLIAGVKTDLPLWGRQQPTIRLEMIFWQLGLTVLNLG